MDKKPVTGAFQRPEETILKNAGELPVEEAATSESPPVEEKYMSAMESVPVVGPTSFGELDDQRELREKVNKIEEITWDAERIMRNIIRSPMNPKEKEKNFKAAASELSSRLNSVESKKKEFDFELTSAEVMHNTIQRSSTVWDVTKDFLGVENIVSIKKELANVISTIKNGGESAENARALLPPLIEKARSMGVGVANEEWTNSIVIEKDTSGDYRWVGWVSNNFKDREGDIIEEAAHVEFVKYLDENPDMAPEFWPWHTKEGARENKADSWMYENGFLVMSGKLTEKEAQSLMEAQKTHDLGMSHGFFGIRGEGEEKHIIKKYRSYEVSDLPLANAANMWTDLETILKEFKMSDRSEYLKAQLGEERFAKIMEDSEFKSVILQESGVESKEVAETTETPAEVAPEVAPAPETTSKELDELVSHVAQELGMAELSKEFEGLQAAAALLPVILDRLDAQEKSTEEKLAEAIASPVSKSFAWQKNRPSEDTSLVVKEDDDIMKEIPTTGWFSEATNSEPL